MASGQAHRQSHQALASITPPFDGGEEDTDTTVPDDNNDEIDSSISQQTTAIDTQIL